MHQPTAQAQRCRERTCCCPFAGAQNPCGRNLGHEMRNARAGRVPGVGPKGAREPPACWQNGGYHDLLLEGAPAGHGEKQDGGDGQGGRAQRRDTRPERPGPETDRDAATAAWLGKATLMLLCAISIAYVLLGAAIPGSVALQAADRILPFLTALVGLVFGFYFSPWRRRL